MITCFPVIENDPSSIKEIYDYYILNSTATFHREKITIPELRNFCLLPPDRRVFVQEFENHSFGEVFRTLLVAMTGLVLARVADPVTAQQVIGMITGIVI